MSQDELQPTSIADKLAGFEQIDATISDTVVVNTINYFRPRDEAKEQEEPNEESIRNGMKEILGKIVKTDGGLEFIKGLSEVVTMQSPESHDREDIFIGMVATIKAFDSASDGRIIPQIAATFTKKEADSVKKNLDTIREVKDPQPTDSNDVVHTVIYERERELAQSQRFPIDPNMRQLGERLMGTLSNPRANRSYGILRGMRAITMTLQEAKLVKAAAPATPKPN